MDERLKTNLDCWNEMARVHLDSPNYRVNDFREGKTHLTRLEREEVGDVQDKSLLHLQCHFGLDTMSWARLGARATGLDFSDQAIDLARSLSSALEAPPQFVFSNLYDAPQEEEHQIAVVFRSHGVCCR